MENDVWMTIFVSVGLILLILLILLFVYPYAKKKMKKDDSNRHPITQIANKNASQYTLPFTIVDIQNETFPQMGINANLKEGENIKLEVEPSNDKNVPRIKVTTEDGTPLGYVDPLIAKSIIDKMDKIMNAKLDDNGNSQNEMEADLTLRL